MSEPLYPIVTDSNAMTITVGPKVFDAPQLHRRPERDMYLKASICGEADAVDRQHVYQHYARYLGAKFNRRFQAANYWLWLGNRMRQSTADMLRIGGTKWHVYCPTLAYLANQVLPYIHEAEADELHQLIPAIVTLQASPQTIRQMVGRGAWRRIANNSVSRNKLIMQALNRTRDRSQWAALFVRLLDVPSGVLPGMQALDDEEFLAARLTPRKNREAFDHTRIYIHDASRMLDVNPAWSLARIRQEHDRAAALRRRMYYSAERFAPDWKHEDAGYSATLLVTPLEIADEGDTQHHCVAGYARDAQAGRYVVLRIEGAERATAGLALEANRWSVQQVYGACNSQVSVACRTFVHRAAIVLSKARFQQFSEAA